MAVTDRADFDATQCFVCEKRVKNGPNCDTRARQIPSRTDGICHHEMISCATGAHLTGIGATEMIAPN